MEWVDMVGHAGSVLSSITFAPQVIQTWKTKRVQDLNLWMMLTVFTSTIVWIMYGIGRMLWPVIICNSIICILALILISLKIKYQQK